MTPAEKNRIEELKQQIREVTGEEPVFGSSPTCPPEVEEAFLERVLWYEIVSRQPLRDRLREAGIVMAKPDDLDDRLLTQKLWDVIHALTLMKVVVSNTDHLSDRDLYTYLWRKVSSGEPVVKPDFYSRGWYIDVTGHGDEGIDVYLKYYASDRERRMYGSYYPDREVPDHVDPPYQRDHLIPDL